jgi:hypothetical protein
MMYCAVHKVESGKRAIQNQSFVNDGKYVYRQDMQEDEEDIEKKV